MATANKKAPVKGAASKPAAKAVGECSVYSVKKKGFVDVTVDANITQNPNGTFMLRGQDEDGNSVAGIIGKDKAASLIKQKLAKKNY